MTIQIPNKAVAATDDLLAPAAELLRGLNLLPSDADLTKAGNFSAAFTGPPQSVAVIEAGITSAAKWWSAGAGGVIVATWGTVFGWWEKQPTALKTSVVWSASVLTAALVLAIGYLLASDVRSRASAATATIEARSAVAVEWIRGVVSVWDPQQSHAVTVVPLAGLTVRLTTKPAADETGWRAIALERGADGASKYVVVKGSSEERASAGELIFEDVPPVAAGGNAGSVVRGND